MAGFFPQHTVHHEWAFHFLILVLFQLGAYEGFQFTEDGPAVVMPEHHTRRFFLHVVQVKLLADFTVVTLRRLFQAQQVSVQGFFIGPCGTIDTLQHLVVAVAAPVGACDLHQLKVMTEAHVRHVRSTAHVDVFFVMVQTRLVIMRNVFVKNRDLIALAALHEGFTRFVPADFLLDDVIVRFGELVHTFFERVDIFLSQGMVKVNVVVETIIDNRTDRHFGVWPQLFDGMAQQVRAGVTNDLQTFFIFCGDDGQCRIVFDQIGGIHQLTVDTAGDGRFRETRTDVQGNIHWANSAVEMALAAIRKSNYRHFISLFAVMPHT